VPPEKISSQGKRMRDEANSHFILLPASFILWHYTRNRAITQIEIDLARQTW
jgi:hypothetical protein